MERSQKEPTGRLLSLRGMVGEYGATEWFWRTQYWARRIPAIQGGKRKLLFDRNDIERFIDENKRTA